MAKASRPQSGALRGASRSQDDSSVSQAAEATSARAHSQRQGQSVAGPGPKGLSQAEPPPRSYLEQYAEGLRISEDQLA